jgi:hypothetical protein
MKQDLEEFKKMIEETDYHISALRTFIQTFPGLAWIKRYDKNTDRFIMVELSNAYMRHIVGPWEGDYINQPDSVFWPEHIAEQFRKNDLEAMTIGQVFVKEKFHSPRTKACGYFEGWKWYFTSKDQSYVAGIGAVLPPDWDEDDKGPE